MYTSMTINTLGLIIFGFKFLLLKFGILFATRRGATIGNDIFLLYASQNFLTIQMIATKIVIVNGMRNNILLKSLQLKFTNSKNNYSINSKLTTTVCYNQVIDIY